MDQTKELTNAILAAAENLRQRGTNRDDLIGALINAGIAEAIDSDGPVFAARILRQAAVDLEQQFNRRGAH